MPKYAVIDIGTNAIKFHIAERDLNRKWKTVLDKAEVRRLGEGLQRQNQISDAAIERNASAIGDLVKLAHKMGVEEILAIGTMALRTAENANKFIKLVKEKCGITVEIISGEEEARLSFLGVQSSSIIPDGEFVIFDIGGGSTEFIYGAENQIDHRKSLNIGVIRITENILKSDPVTGEECEMAYQSIDEIFAVLPVQKKIKSLIGVGATLTTLGAMKSELPFDQIDDIHGSELSLNDVEKQISLLKSKTISERKKIVGLDPRRADVILAGSMIVKSAMNKFGVACVTISDRGVRHGLLIDRFDRI